LENFTEKVQSVKKILNLWSYRDLTYIGKVTVVKTLALPILVQCLTVLPNPPESILNDIEKIFYKFLWNGKKGKIKRSIIINEYEEGGLKMPNIQSFLSFSIKFNFPILLIRSFHLYGMALRILKYSIRFNLIL
jgi:hypothetical protein